METDLNTPLIRQFEAIQGTGAAIAGYTSGLCGEWTAERFSLFAEHLGIDPARITVANQKHTDRVYAADLSDGGMGSMKPWEGAFFDAMITDRPGLMLSVNTADCVPVAFFDPVTQAIGIAHSGWMGTSMEIAGKTVRNMKEAYGCAPEHMICCLGPYNHACCYEVGEDVREAFRERFSEEECGELFLDQETGENRRAFSEKERGESDLNQETAGKYLLDLGKAISISLRREGVLTEHIHDSGHCTFHTEEYSSWRRTKNKKHQILSYIMLPVLR